MKRSLYILALLALVGCQTIPEADRLVEVDPATLTTNRTTLICEYSGYLCVNCPNAAEEAHNLLHQFSPNLVVVEMHPASNSFTRYTKEEYNYTCPAADIYYKAAGGTAATGFPTGVVNLKGGFVDYTAWGGLYVASAAKQSTVALRATTAYDPATREVNTSVEMTNLQDTKQKLQLVVWLTEDSIIGAQKMPDGSSRTDYVHNHLLRDTLTQAWGEPLTLIGTLRHDIAPYTLPQKCVAEHCHLVVLALRDEEVVQALEVPVVNL